jgi:hypothetical protein
MKVTKDKLKDKIINRINSLSRDKLKNIDEFIDKLENERHSKQEVLTYAGVWKDLEEETFQDLTEHLHAKRKRGNERIL